MFGIISLASFALAVAAMVLIFLAYFKNRSLLIPYIIFFVCIIAFGASTFLFVKGPGETAEDPSSQPSGPAPSSSFEIPSASPSDTAADENTPSPDELLAFDEKTWNDFKNLYAAHNSLMDTMQKYADGTVSAVSFYDYCEKAEQYFANASLSFFYGENDYQGTYLSAFQSMALSDQMAAKALLKYLDSFKTSDLSEARENINQATNAATTIASNRGKLLVLAGLSDEEIRIKVEADTADLD